MFAITKNEQRLPSEYRLLRQACLAAWHEPDTNPGVYSILDMPPASAVVVLAARELRDMKIEPDYWPMYRREFEASRAAKASSPSHG